MKIETPEAKARPLSKKSVVKIIQDISNVNTLAWIGVAVVIHAVVISALSVNNIRDWADPEGAKVRAAAEAKKDQPPPAAPAPAAQPAPAAPSAEKTKAAAAKEPTEDEKMMEKRKDSPVMKAITGKAKPTEVPKEPHSDGISLDDTLNNK
jgi:outer membrane biosynthesis protein TonB